MELRGGGLRWVPDCLEMQIAQRNVLLSHMEPSKIGSDLANANFNANASANPNAKRPHKKHKDHVYDAQEDFPGSWLHPVFQTLVRNALKIGLAPQASL